MKKPTLGDKDRDLTETYNRAFRNIPIFLALTLFSGAGSLCFILHISTTEV